MENLNEALATLINQATAGIDASMGFLQAEIPDVIVQLLMWHGVYNAILAVVGLILLVVIPCAYFRLAIYITKPYPAPIDHPRYSSVKMHSKISGQWSTGGSFEEFNWILLLVVSGFASVIGATVGLVMLNLTWLQIWIAPKVWLIEYAANLVK